jgi:hypothetical protein
MLLGERERFQNTNFHPLFKKLMQACLHENSLQKGDGC